MYKIREVNAQDEDIVDTLEDLHRLTFFGGRPFRNSITGIGGSL